jgi:cytochrome c-type biogenesis protein CcmH/NrfG
VDNQDYTRAELAFRKALAIDPRNSETANNLGNIAYLKGDIIMAQTYWRKAVVANSSNAEALYNLGRVAEQQGKSQEAKVYYQKFLRVAPPDLADWIKEAKERLTQLDSPTATSQ